MRKLSPSVFKTNKYILFAALIFITGAVVRVIFLAQNPAGFNQDEASAGYEAFSLLNWGIDRNGQSFPAMFIAWGSGQNVLYSYLSIPFIAIFGLNVFSVRIAASLAGIAALVVFYLLCRRLRGDSFALIGLFILAINPWHIMISRWALESNLLPLALLTGMYFLVLSLDRKYFIIPSALMFALSLYCYSTAFIYIPLFLLLCLPYLIKRRAFTLAYIPAATLFILVALPITCCLIINMLDLPSFKLFGLTLPVLTEGRQLKTTIFGSGDFLNAARENFLRFLFMLSDQDDGMPWSAFAPYGLYYLWGLPAAGLGAYRSVKKIKDSPHEIILLCALAASMLCAFIINVNINRMNMLFLPLIYFNAVGISFLCSLLKRAGLVVILAHVLAFCMFINSYFTEFRKEIAAHFYDGLGEAVILASAKADGRRIVVTERVHMPYIYVLFYTQTPVREFIDTVEYYNPEGDFRWTHSFSNYRFGIGTENISEDAVHVTATDELWHFDDSFEIIECGNYYVVSK